MGSYVRVKRRVWHDEKVQPLAPEAKLLFMYLLTSPHGNALGCYVLRRGYALEDLGWDTATFDLHFQALLDAGVIRYDPETHVVLIPRFLAHNPITHRNQAKAAISALDELPTTHLFVDLLKTVEELGKGFLQDLAEALRQRLANASQKTSAGASPKSSAKSSQKSSKKPSDKASAKDRANNRIPNTENRIPNTEPPPQETLPPPGTLFDLPSDGLVTEPVPAEQADTSKRRRRSFEGYTPEFEQAWSVYPRHEAKRGAFEQWQRRLKERLDDGTPITPELLIQAAQNYAEACRVRGTDSRYIMLGKTFFGPHHRFADFIRPVRDSPEPPPPVDTDESFLAAIRRMRRHSPGDGGETSEPEAGEAVRHGTGHGAGD